MIYKNKDGDTVDTKKDKIYCKDCASLIVNDDFELYSEGKGQEPKCTDCIIEERSSDAAHNEEPNHKRRSTGSSVYDGSK